MTVADDARRARQAAASRAYRARQKQANPPEAPRKNHGGGVVDAARAQSEKLRREREATISQLPDVRNLRANIRPKEERPRSEGKPKKTKAAQERRAKTIRDQANASRVVDVGRAKKDILQIELTDGPRSELFQEMSTHNRQRFRTLIDRITRGSNQSLGILFAHLGGQDMYYDATNRILYKPTEGEGFDLLETLAEYAETAAREYAPSKVGQIRV